MKRARAAVLVVLAIAALHACGEKRARPPDVVLVLLDTLRPDYLGFLGHERESAPFLAELASGSAVLRRAWATSSWTAPSTASLFTSWRPSRHGVEEGFFAHRARAERVRREGRATLSLNRLPPDHETLAELFRDSGYRTFGLASNINIGPEIGFARGFDRFERRHQASAGELAEVLAGWMEEDDGARPRLIYLHLNDVHGPYTPRPPWYEAKEGEVEDPAALYRGEIGYVDDVLRRMFDRHGWASSDAVVAVVSDHGQEFGDHGRHGHGFSLYRELVQVLALVHAPKRGVLAGELYGNVSLLDVLPTLAELAGLEPRPEWQGVSLARALRGEADPGLHERDFVSHRVSTRGGRRRELWSIVRGDWHLIERQGVYELYDLERDPRERNDLAAARPEVVRELAERLTELRARDGERGAVSAVDVEIDAERLRALEALGYVD